MSNSEKLNLAFIETSTAYVGIGSNLGDKRQLALFAIDFLNQMDGITVVQRSSLYRSAPIGETDQDWFVNGVIKIKTNLSPRELLAALHLTELQLGRRRELHWGPRTIDLDLLFYDDFVFEESDLTVPHPEAHKRHFVLLPLCEIAPRLVHPALKKSVLQLLRELPEKTACAPLSLNPSLCHPPLDEVTRRSSDLMQELSKNLL